MSIGLQILCLLPEVKAREYDSFGTPIQEVVRMFIPCHTVVMATYYVEKITISCLPPTGYLFGTRQSPSLQDSAGNHYRSQQKIIKGDGPTLCLHISQTKRKKKGKTALLTYRFLDIGKCC